MATDDANLTADRPDPRAVTAALDAFLDRLAAAVVAGLPAPPSAD